ncbi:MAG: orotidine-5'-phosphate decarboxylase [Candidatus Magasanikbacteria bacterium]|nr:orotidine-5'-phosphate decarboxylase [Candidatus Magasanikbacteria bacterium]
MLKIEERLIVSADFSPKDFGGLKGVEKEILSLAKDLEGLGVYIKVNSALRAIGYDLITQLHNLGLKVFADLKLNDIPKTMQTDAELLAEFKPEILTVMCSSGVDGMNAVQQVLGDITEILGVTVLTSLDEENCQSVFACTSEQGVVNFAKMAKRAGLGGIILSPKEAQLVKQLNLGLSLNTPGVRPLFTIVKNDDQARINTPTKALQSGADRLVIGRPITQSKNPKEAVLKILEEIREAKK